ncbi:hypothetical protein RFI_12129, partial [Reticulomyxa filosa]
MFRSGVIRKHTFVETKKIEICHFFQINQAEKKDFKKWVSPSFPWGGKKKKMTLSYMKEEDKQLEPKTVNQWLELERKEYQSLSFGCPYLDRCVNGGLRKGLCEISGESGTGKTQLAMQLLFQVQLTRKDGGFNGNSLFLTTKEPIHRERFLQIHAENYVARYGNIHSFLDHIFIHHAHTLEEQNAVMSNGLMEYIKNRNVKLIIVDSISALYRFMDDDNDDKSAIQKKRSGLEEEEKSYNEMNMNEDTTTTTTTTTTKQANANDYDVEYDHDNEYITTTTTTKTRDESNVLKENKVFIVRAKLLYELCNHLKELCDKYNCIVIFINDVGDVFETKDILTIHSMENCIFSKGRYVKPALGIIYIYIYIYKYYIY